MDPDKNSSSEDILAYIKISPTHFLSRFLNKTWAQPYIDEAAKMAVEEESFEFIYYFSNDLWAQPYMGKAAKEVVKINPYFFLHNFSNKPWAQPYLDDAAKGTAKKEPEYFMEKWADRFPHHVNLALFALGDKNGSKSK